MRSFALLFSLVALCAVCALPGQAKKSRQPKKPPVSKAQKAAPWTRKDAQNLVSAGRLPPFYNPDNLAMLPVLSAPSAIIVDAETGQVLFEKNADKRRPIASTTKIMTALLFIEHTRPEDIVTCNDANITKIEESSLHIKPGEKFTAENLLYGFLLRSGNDAGVVIAQHVGGSVAGFADLMNARAAEIGCTDSHFVNPHGLTVPEHYSSARDLSRIARVAMHNSRFAEAVRLPVRTIERSINKGDVHIVSRMKRRFHEKFPGADGIKTGNTQAAGYCFVGSATRDDHRLISVVLGARGGSSIDDTCVLQGWAFRRFAITVLAKKGEPVGQVLVKNGAIQNVVAVAPDDIKALADSLSRDATPLTMQFVPETTLVAPVAKDAVVGQVRVMQGETMLTETKAIAKNEVGIAPLQAAVGGISGGAWQAPAFATLGGLSLSLILWRTYRGFGGKAGPVRSRKENATTITKSTGRRRNRVPTQRRGDDSRRSH